MEQPSVHIILLTERNVNCTLDEVLLKKKNFTDSASSTPEFMFEYTDPSFNLGVLELKLHLSAKGTKCSFNPNVNKEVAKYPNAKLARRGVLGLPPS